MKLFPVDSDWLLQEKWKVARKHLNGDRGVEIASRADHDAVKVPGVKHLFNAGIRSRRPKHIWKFGTTGVESRVNNGGDYDIRVVTLNNFHHVLQSASKPYNPDALHSSSS